MRRLLKTSRRGFTLIELMVAAAVTLIIITVALAVLVRFSAFRRRQEWVELTRRSAAQALGQLTSEVRKAGLGCPTGASLEGTPPPLFPPVILRAAPNELVFLADLPRPHVDSSRPGSDFNGVSTIASDQGPNLSTHTWVAIVNELSGSCVPYNVASPSCSTHQTSLIFSNDSQPHCNADASSRTCPWGLGRYEKGEPLLLVNGAGQWIQRSVSAAQLDSIDPDFRRSLRLDGAALPNKLLEGPSPGFISTPDRLTYKLVKQGTLAAEEHLRLVREQCWGQLNVANPLAPCNPAGYATPEETLLEYDMPPTASHPMSMAWQDTLRFTYHTANGTQLVGAAPSFELSEAQRRQVRQVRLHLQLVRRPPASDPSRRDYQDYIEYSTRLTIDLRN